MRAILPMPPCGGAPAGRGAEVFVIGAGGHAKVVVATLQAANRPVGAIFDDDPARHGQAVLTVPVAGPVPEAAWWADEERFGLLAIGDNGARRHVARRLGGLRWTTALHPSATIHPSAAIIEGVLIGAHAVVQADATVGAHAIINTGAIVEHDCRIGAFCHIAPGAVLTGNVVVEEGALVGAGSVIVPNLTIGAWSTVGAGSVVTRPVAAHQVIVGVPGRSLARAGGASPPLGSSHQE